ncbi:hypothetical protein GGD83_002765 [Rhodoblastus sphagnicola]|uniref:hypothetical protein n=1 Tax=Rhodoblastus sphagnicola TaxID=333368 RepID=UPI0011B0EC15|nr:hypothetical protein [Rhodoblastus sphagnicola]MBB4198954.1 hypothetical protein [Rhodoblastus sphagnicola]
MSGDDKALARIHILSLPFPLKQRPFIQGLCESAAMGEDVAASIAAAVQTPAEHRDDDWSESFRALAETRPVFCGLDVVELPDGVQAADAARM